MLLQNKYLQSNMSGEKLPPLRGPSHLYFVQQTRCFVSPVSLLFWKVPFPNSPLHVDTQGAPILFNVMGAILAAADWSKSKHLT